MPVQLATLNSQAAIFARLWEGRMTAPLARQVLKLQFSESDRARMSELSLANQRGELNSIDTEELDDYIRIGDLLALLQSKARQLLKASPTPRNGHGRTDR